MANSSLRISRGNNEFYKYESKNRIIGKPWGYERIIEHNSDYMIKELVIQSGEELSLQYHLLKKETMVFQRGNGDIYFGYNPISLEHIRYYPGFSITFDPLIVHKVIASEYTIVLECSTSFFEDTIRISDKYGRKNI